jgi:hypothetical protein
VKIAFTDGVKVTANFAITVNPAPTNTLTGITITTPPTKNTYDQGDSVFDYTGLVISAVYSVSGAQTITYTTADAATKAKFSVEDFVTSAPGSVTVKIAFTDGAKVTANFTITVNPASPGGTGSATMSFTVTDLGTGLKITRNGGGVLSITKGGTLTLEVNLTGISYGTLDWKVDGVSVPVGNGNPTVAIDTGGYRTGGHNVILVIEKGGVYYSSDSVTFTVTN